MTAIEVTVNKRIQTIDLNLLCDMVDKFERYGVKFYNRKGEFVFNKFKKDCIKTSKLLFKNDKPVNDIRYQLCDFMSAVQTIVGIRNIAEFMSEN